MVTLNFPYPEGPRDYQQQATQNWLDNDCVGFFEMATGTGKTLTALNCALKLYEQKGFVRLLILVPTLTLAEQWKEEVQNFGVKKVVLTNGTNSSWPKQALTLINAAFTQSVSFAIIATYATFLTNRFQSVVSKLDERILLIADEAHNFGTPKMIERYPTHIRYRLGLSATPYRYFDEPGSQAMLNYFNSSSGVTFSFDIKTAIRQRYLSEYYYYPTMVELTRDELLKYKEISRKLMRYFDAKSEQFKQTPAVTNLLLQRKRIIHTAANKKDIFRAIIGQLLKDRGTINHTLVYVPEGYSNQFDDEDQRLIDEYASIVAQEFSLSQHQFIGETDQRPEILQQFSTGEIAVLTAMKCLDEGIDVKRTEIAVFCASTGNSRQFIQRRGRILRTHPDKQFAYIYDLVVVPAISEIDVENSLSMEKSLLANELKRVHEFAEDALNKYAALERVDRVAQLFEINIYSK